VATYFTDDFADFGTDWTERYNTTPTWSVSSGDLTVPTGVSGDWCAVTWDDIDGDANRADVEALILVTLPAASLYPIILRASGADESASLYTLRLATTSIRSYYCNAADTPTQIASASASLTAGVDYWVRFRVNGTSIQVRVWADGGGEPGTWTLDSTDSTVSGVGWSGLSIYTNSGAGATIKQVGFGTNGDAAPDAGGSGVTGTLATTNANDSSAASGSTTIIGTVAYNNNNDTSAASGSTTTIGTLNTTNANDIVAATGAAGAVTGTVAKTNNNDTVSAAGVVPIVGTLSKTNANDTISASGTSGTGYSVTIKAGSWIRYRIIT